MNKRYNIITIQHYLTGKLSNDEMYQLERQALEDPMLQDALDGFMNTEEISHNRLSLLQKRLESRIIEQHEERSSLHFTWQRLAVASVAGMLLIVIGILFWMVNTPSKSGQRSTIKGVEVSLTPSLVSASLEVGNIEPLNGWKDYNHYLETHYQEKIAGQKVLVSFEVSFETPVNIKVISAESKQAGHQAVRLIKDGPKWKGESGKITILF